MQASFAKGVCCSFRKKLLAHALPRKRKYTSNFSVTRRNAKKQKIKSRKIP
jgi:hypothetical protein